MRETERGTEHISINEAKVIQSSTVSSSAMYGQLPLPLTLRDAIKHRMLDPHTGVSQCLFFCLFMSLCVKLFTSSSLTVPVSGTNDKFMIKFG